MSATFKRIMELVGKDVLIVQIDGKAFRGRLTDAGENAIFITDAVEYSPAERKWRIPQVTVPGEPAGDDGRRKTEISAETYKLRDIIITYSSVIRIYPLASKTQPAEKTYAPSPFLKIKSTEDSERLEKEREQEKGKVYVIRSSSSK